MSGYEDIVGNDGFRCSNCKSTNVVIAYIREISRHAFICNNCGFVFARSEELMNLARIARIRNGDAYIDNVEHFLSSNYHR